MKKINFFIGLLLVLFMVSGCSISVNSKDTSKIDGGVFVSTNKGETWSQTVSYPTVKGVESLNSLDTSSLALNPNDSKNIYFATVDQGLYYSYDLSRGWEKSYALSNGTVLTVAVSPDDKCRVYAAMGNKLYVSKDCNRTYEQTYFDNDTSVLVSAVAIDSYDSNKIYIGTSKGDILRSSDRGSSWQTIYRAGFRVIKIILDPADTRIIIAATNGAGLFRSMNGGVDWISLSDNLKDFKNSNKIVDVLFVPVEKGLIFAAVSSGILKTQDYGDSWTSLDLITNEKESSVEALAVNPVDAKEIYYATKTTFYSSSDGGANWKTKKLPSSRSGATLLIKPDQPSIIFMGLKKYNSAQGTYY